MAVANLPLISVLKTRMHWHQTRQKVLSENVSHADTPGFQPKDLRAPGFTARGEPIAGRLPVIRTNYGHLTGGAPRTGEDAVQARHFETTPSGNAVNLEDEMLKVAQNQSDFQLAASLYQKSLQMLRLAAGRR